MRLERDDETVSWDQVAELFSSVGWGQRDPDAIQSAFSYSSFKAFAFDGDELVGVGRTIDDGRFYATIVDKVVHPAYQRKRVGSAIVEYLQSRLEGFLVVTLTAAPDV